MVQFSNPFLKQPSDGRQHVHLPGVSKVSLAAHAFQRLGHAFIGAKDADLPLHAAEFKGVVIAQPHVDLAIKNINIFCHRLIPHSKVA